MSDEENPKDEYRRRQRARNWVLGGLLGGMVLLIYLIAIVRIGGAAG